MDCFISIGEAAKRLGVSTVPLRRWGLAGKLKPAMRTFGDHRRYSEQDISARLPQSERVNVL